MIEGIQRILQPIKNKIFLMIGRAILSAIDSSGQTNLIQVKGLNSEVITDMEYPTPYGFEAKPTQGQVVFVNVNGNRDQSIALIIHDRENKPTDLEDDETQLYSKFNNYVKCNKDAEVEVNGSADYAVAYNDLKTAFDELKSDFNTFVTVYNSHNHPTAPTGPVSTPSVAGSTSSADMSPSKVDKVRLP